MTVGFWNINKKKLDKLINDFVYLNQIDILILAESPYEDSAELLKVLNQRESNFYYVPLINCEKLQFYVKFKPTFKLFKLLSDLPRFTAHSVFSPKYGSITLIAVHFQSKVNWSNEDQAAYSPVLKEFIDSVEQQQGHKRTIVCGDFNMNPFDAGMVQTTGLHSVMDRHIANKGSRVVLDKAYDFFYNPMWSFLGDLGKGDVSGTFYHNSSNPINYHWNLLDQVLVRPSLIKDFSDQDLDITIQIGDVKLLSPSKIVNKKYSDHLPIKFKIKI